MRTCAPAVTGCCDAGRLPPRRRRPHLLLTPAPRQCHRRSSGSSRTPSRPPPRHNRRVSTLRPFRLNSFHNRVPDREAPPAVVGRVDSGARRQVHPSFLRQAVGPQRILRSERSVRSDRSTQSAHRGRVPCRPGDRCRGTSDDPGAAITGFRPNMARCRSRRRARPRPQNRSRVIAVPPGDRVGPAPDSLRAAMTAGMRRGP